jgi:hypothetical protein
LIEIRAADRGIIVRAVSLQLEMAEGSLVDAGASG